MLGRVVVQVGTAARPSEAPLWCGGVAGGVSDSLSCRTRCLFSPSRGRCTAVATQRLHCTPGVAADGFQHFSFCVMRDAVRGVGEVALMQGVSDVSVLALVAKGVGWRRTPEPRVYLGQGHVGLPWEPHPAHFILHRWRRAEASRCLVGGQAKTDGGSGRG